MDRKVKRSSYRHGLPRGRKPKSTDETRLEPSSGIVVISRKRINSTKGTLIP